MSSIDKPMPPEEGGLKTAVKIAEEKAAEIELDQGVDEITAIADLGTDQTGDSLARQSAAELSQQEEEQSPDFTKPLKPRELPGLLDTTDTRTASPEELPPADELETPPPGPFVPPNPTLEDQSKHVQDIEELLN